MKYTLTVNQKQAIEAGVKNINQAHILDLLTSCSTWATPEEFKGEIYYWVSRQSVCRELPLLNIKPDTAYRHLKGLAELGLIDYQKSGKKDLVRLTPKGKKYYVGNKSEFEESHYVGNKSEKQTGSEIDPSKSGNKSEKNSETNPTYPTTKEEISNTNDQADADRELEAPVSKKSSNHPKNKSTSSDIRFPIFDDWVPSDQFSGICLRGGLSNWQELHNQENLTEFILYWSGQPSEQTQYNWDLKYFKQLQRIKTRGHSHGNGKGNNSNEPDFESTSWL